jgi:hypothetical protein
VTGLTLFILLWLFPIFASAEDKPEFRHVPVYSYAEDEVLKRSGTFIYEVGNPAFRMLYCISDPPPKVLMHCVVHTPNDLLVLVEVAATGHST